MADFTWTLAAVANSLGGTLKGDGTVSFRKVVTDSRADVRGALFVALVGDNFDAHHFLGDVRKRGAVGAVVGSEIPGLDLPCVVVADTLVALQTLARKQRDRFDGQVVGITGSSGKTTTRTLTASILNQIGSVHQPIRNFNNHVGVPLTLLDIEPEHQYAVLELGCSDFGEIALLTRLCDPQVALVTNVGPAHLEKLGDLEGVARAKGELFETMNSGGIAVVNLDDPRVAKMNLSADRKLTYSANRPADLRLISRTVKGAKGQEVALDLRGERIEAELPLFGAHNAANALAAAAIAVALDVDSQALVEGLARVEAEPGRLSVHELAGGGVIIDDTYNANPASMAAALDVLLELGETKRTVAVLGDMLELGDASIGVHLELGRRAVENSVDLLIAVGSLSENTVKGALIAGLDPGSIVHADNHEQALHALSVRMLSGDVILVKGSRGMRLEHVVKGVIRSD